MMCKQTFSYIGICQDELEKESSNEDEAVDNSEKKQKKRRSGKSDVPSRKRTKGLI